MLTVSRAVLGVMRADENRLRPVEAAELEGGRHVRDVDALRERVENLDRRDLAIRALKLLVEVIGGFVTNMSASWIRNQSPSCASAQPSANRAVRFSGSPAHGSVGACSVQAIPSSRQVITIAAC
jgi:hypothetical protein